ncbi:transcriptional regulator [Bordetella genomosp. 6]|uniref:transcriptional regulator n=1 Tax=Bordetella genomosp. 6 TaxID=463024 RepID=UPI000A297090|nr:transcriptional regulator [Bordetella genomosp. 6]ARP76974.1 transcriptional regulator [Bordetella genomosp. 6]
MVYDFTLVYALNPELDSQDEILRRLAGSDCADGTVGWGRPRHVALAFSREARDLDVAVTFAAAQMAQVLPGVELVHVDVG